MFPLLTSPRARKRGRAEYREGAVPLRRARSSARRTGGTRADGGEAGMEKPTTEEVGRDDLEVEESLESPEAGRSKDAQDFLRTGGADAGAGAVEVDAAGGGVGVEISAEGEGATTAESGTSTRRVPLESARAAALAVASLASGTILFCEWVVPAADIDVVEDSGETGTGRVSDTVEISVPEEDTVSGSGKSLGGDSAESTVGFGGSSGGACVDKEPETTATPDGGTILATTGFGDSGGMGSRRAFSITSGGGREWGDMMIPGARDGSVGRRDQMAQPPSCGFG